MNCSSFKQQIMLSLRGDLPSKEKQELMNHLSLCSECRKDMEEFKEVFILTEVQEDIPKKHLDRIYHNTLRSHKRRKVRRKQQVLIAALLLALLSLFSVVALDLFEQTGPLSAMKGMVLIEGGRFQMGDQFGEGGGDEGPAHMVKLSSFYLGAYEVTVKEFDRFIRETGYLTSSDFKISREELEKQAPNMSMQKLYEMGGCFKWDSEKNVFEYDRECAWSNPLIEQTDRDPVVCLSWVDVIHYCNWLSEKEGMPVAYDLKTGSLLDENGAVTEDILKVRGYRLPTEAEWEFAAREGGKKVRFGNGKNMAHPDEMNYDGAAASYPYSKTGEYKNRTTPVGSYAPNGLGLYDMSGNAWEWCGDSYTHYIPSEQTNPFNCGTPIRVVRGGRWGGDAKDARVSQRAYFEKSNRCNNIGFRLAKSN